MVPSTGGDPVVQMHRGVLVATECSGALPIFQEAAETFHGGVLGRATISAINARCGMGGAAGDGILFPLDSGF